MTMRADDIFLIEAAGIRVEIDLAAGHIAGFRVTREGRTVAPLHRAPWADDQGPVAGTEDAPVVAHLSGDFLCAPFSTADVELAPAHGWTASSRWRPIATRSLPDCGTAASFALERPVMGARVVKELRLMDGHPFLYQRHLFEGGEGALPVAHHAMVRLPAGGRLAVSPKRRAETPPTPLEPDPALGRSALAYPAVSADLDRVPKADGTFADLTRYPIDDGHEDFIMLVEAAGADLGWSAVTRSRENDLVLVLKDPACLPVTMLWYSNGGRYYPPWSGRHRGVLGIEDGRTASLLGQAASSAPNALSAEGIPTALELRPDGTVEVRQVIGAVPVPVGFGRVRSLVASAGRLAVEDDNGVRLDVPFDDAFLGGTS